jgi:high-affinity Fe2+/Pb2+ permease
MKRASYSRRELLLFGTIMGLLLGTLGCWGLWLENYEWSHTRISLVSTGGLFILAGLAQPNSLKPILDLWMVLTGFIGHTLTLVLLTLLYIAVVFPIGGTRRLFGADPMGKKSAPSGEGYWRRPETDGRGKKAFEQQF